MDLPCPVHYCAYTISFSFSFYLTNHKCILNKPTPCWANVPVPTQESLIHFLAMCSHVTMGGQLSIDIDNIVFCPSSSMLANTKCSADSKGLPPSSKHRKYSSYAPSCVPVSSASNTARGSVGTSAPFDNVASSSTSATLNMCVT